jgi:VCBS repeat-containing protein
MSIRLRVAYLAPAAAAFLAIGCGGGGGGGSGAPPPPPANRAPVITTTTLLADEDVRLAAQLLATDADGNALTFTVVTGTTHGALLVAANGTLTYTSDANYNGADSFSVRVADGAGGEATGTVAVTVRPVNDLPQITSIQFTVTEDNLLTGQITATDVEGDAVTYAYESGIQHGILTLAPSGAFTYTPNLNYAGGEQMLVRAGDAGGVTAALPIAITVTPVNDGPTANDDELRVSAAAGENVALPVLANDTDPDGNALTPIVIDQPRGGTVAVSPITQQLTFYPDNEFLGPIEFTYRVSDGSAVSQTATARAVIGAFENIVFLSDYTTPGVPEIHLFDGLAIRRLSDDVPTGGTIVHYTWSGDARVLSYQVDSASNDRIYVKPVDGSAPAKLIYTSGAKGAPQAEGTFARLNRDGTFALINDPWTTPGKHAFAVNTATNATTRVGENMPAVVDTRLIIFNPRNPQQLLVQGQIGGVVPRIFTNDYMTVFTADANDARVLTQIGANYALGGGGSGEGFWVSGDGRYIYYGEQLYGQISRITQLVYDTVNHTETPMLRRANYGERGGTGNANISNDARRFAFAFNEPSSTQQMGPARFYAGSGADPAGAIAVSPTYAATSQCSFGSDNRTLVYRIYTPGFGSQEVYAVDSITPGVPLKFEPASEIGSEQGDWQVAPNAMRIAVAYFTYDGVLGSAGQTGRFYSMPLDGSGQPFLFSTNYVVGQSIFFSSNDVGSLIAYPRPTGGINALELMSTRSLNHSFPLSRAGQTIGMRQASWLRPY